MPQPRGVRTTATTAYFTRNFERELRDRLRIAAAQRKQTMECVLNEAVRIGLRLLEREPCPPAATP